MHPEVREVLQTPDALERARRASDLLNAFQVDVNELARIRREAIEELLRSGKTQTEVAAALGMHRSRINQLIKSGPAPERAFLGSGTITIAIGGKVESGRVDDAVQPVVSAEAFAAYEAIAALSQTMGLKAEHEVVPPPGLVDLNRPDLVVLAGPRLLPLVGQILASDPNLGFGRDERGWFLVDRTAGVEYRSPRDAGEQRDYAYIGRLPRPDGRGGFLYMSGIHSTGTLGAAVYLERNIGDLYREVKTGRFSQLIECTYDPDNGVITSTAALSPLYRHEGS